METTIGHIVMALNEMRQNLGVVSTVHADGSPEAAVVYFSYDEQLNLYFTTRKSSRKYQNLTRNPHAAFVVFGDTPPETIQLEGTASFVTDPGEQARLFAKVVELATKHNPQPPVDQLGESEIAFVRITTTWARFGNFEVTRTGDVFQEAIA